MGEKIELLLILLGFFIASLLVGLLPELDTVYNIGY